jgi:hypothetical protein
MFAYDMKAQPRRLEHWEDKKKATSTNTTNQ